MLHKKNGKYLSEEYYDLRNKGLVDRSDIVANDQIFADISFPDGGGRYDDCTHVLYSVYKGKKYDRRKLPKVSD